MEFDTIFALATPEGVSGVAIIRVSGPKSLDIRETLAGPNIEDRLGSLRNIHDPRTHALLDQALVLWFQGPRSFTGEDVLELQLHGSYAAIDAVSEVLLHLGCRPANPGEFSRRALTNGKLDLISAEALDDLIHATDPATLALAHGQAGHVRQQLFEKWRLILISLQAACEALIDFPEDDLPEELTQENERALSLLVKEIQQLEVRSDRAMELKEGLEILLVGPPNAGKSTFLNALAGYERAIVSVEPGTTRDFVELDTRIAAFKVRFVDTAGLRETDGLVENLGIQRTKDRFSAAALILNLHDDSQEPEAIVSSAPIWTIQTKGLIEGTRSIAAADEGQPGVKGLLEEIEEWLGQTYGSVLTDLSFQRDRQVFHVKQMAESLRKAQYDHLLPELQAEHLRQASQDLAYLSGIIHVEDVLDQLFSGFCIGK